MTIEETAFLISMAGTVAFAVSAVLSVAERNVDLFAAIVLGIITAVGGGTVRDLILDVPVFWATETSYIWVATAASVAAFVAYRFFKTKIVRRLFLYIDGFAVSMFAIQAVSKVWRLEFGLPLAPIILGVITAIGGGLTRDLLAGRPTLLMSRELYAVPVLIGCIVYAAILSFAPQHENLGAMVCWMLIFGIRAAAIHWDLQVPDWATLGAGKRK